MTNTMGNVKGKQFAPLYPPQELRCLVTYHRLPRLKGCRYKYVTIDKDKNKKQTNKHKQNETKHAKQPSHLQYTGTK